jgi:hypothetical protein
MTVNKHGKIASAGHGFLAVRTTHRPRALHPPASGREIETTLAPRSTAALDIETGIAPI